MGGALRQSLRSRSIAGRDAQAAECGQQHNNTPTFSNSLSRFRKGAHVVAWPDAEGARALSEDGRRVGVITQAHLRGKAGFLFYRDPLALERYIE